MKRHTLLWATLAMMAIGCLLDRPVAAETTDLLSTEFSIDKSTASRGETVTFTALLKNNDADGVLNVSCAVSYQDPSTGQTATVASNSLQITRLGLAIVAPLLSIPSNAALEIILNSFTVDGEVVTPTNGSNSTTVSVSDLPAGQARTVRWRAAVK
jgi:uncharacterized repeat protein (TIGR01451 family)